MRRAQLTMAAFALTLALAACSSAETPDPGADPTSPSGEPEPTSSSASPSQDPDGWRDDFSSAELDAYDAALSRWSEYEERSAPVWAAGVATNDAERLFREYFASPAWQIAYDRLETYEEVEVKIPQPPKVLWSRGKRIDVQGANGSVVLIQCVDLTAQGTTQFGDPVKWPKGFRKPVLREITLDRRGDSDWLVTRNEPPSSDSFERCSLDGQG